jgi:hypothetical protein
LRLPVDFCSDRHRTIALSHLQNDLFAHTLRYARNFILGISIGKISRMP